MDQCIMESSNPVQDIDRYAISYNIPGVGLSLSALDCIMGLKPALKYIDKSDDRVKSEKKKEEEEDDGDYVYHNRG